MTNKYNLPVNYEKLTHKQRKEVREQYIKEQDGKCYHCGFPLDGKPDPEVRNHFITWDLFPKGFRKSPIHLHHNHDTDLTIGAVHAYCNAVLWQYHGE